MRLEGEENRKCSVCGSPTTYIDKTKWGIYPHWRYNSSGKPICGRCYTRATAKRIFVPDDVKCVGCGRRETIRNKYGISLWVKNRSSAGGYLCWSCNTIRQNTGRVVSTDTRNKIRKSVKQALEAGVTMGRKLHSLNESVFDIITEKSAYWIGFIMSDGNIYFGGQGNPRISVKLGEQDYNHLAKFKIFLNCSNPIVRKIERTRGREFVECVLRFSSKKLAHKLIEFGITPRKSLTAKVIGLENNKHFWRGVLDGDGSIVNRNGRDADTIVLTSNNDLLCQFKDFIQRNISGSPVAIRQHGNINQLHVYSNTARMVAQLLYRGCNVALDRKEIKARLMFESLDSNKTGNYYNSVGLT